jgi:hypothetical protein
MSCAHDEHGEVQSLRYAASQVRSLSLKDQERVTRGGVPGCFSAEQWESWRAAARILAPSPLHGYCEDCTPQFKRQKRAIGLCAFPEVVFYKGDGFRLFNVRQEPTA